MSLPRPGDTHPSALIEAIKAKRSFDEIKQIIFRLYAQNQDFNEIKDEHGRPLMYYLMDATKTHVPLKLYTTRTG